MALEADLPEVLIRSGPNPRSLLTLVLVSVYDNYQFYFLDLRSVDAKTLATLAFLDPFGTEQGLLIVRC